ncbi:MAG: deoxyribodipyrimidine photolyase [Flavobacteriaceae bacterium]|nr:deoxyribodipyrimidine photolyase [Flavobacteriaceae bacterium]
MQNQKALIWFRNNLRILDNNILNKALQSNENIIAYYNFDSKFFKSDRWGFNKTEKFRAKFLIETIENLKKSLKTLNISLIIDQCSSSKGLIDVIKKYGINSLYYQKEWTDEEQKVEQNLINELPHGFNLKSYYDQFLYHPEDIMIKPKEIPDVFSVFRKRIEKKIRVRECFTQPLKLDKSNLLNEDFEIPTLESLKLKGFEVNINSAFPFKGGTSEAFNRIDFYFWKTKKLGFYKKTRNGLIKPDYSSKLSSWLANGSISARQIYWEVKNFENEILKNQSTYWLIFELIWRDYFKYISLKYGNKIFQLKGLDSDIKVWKNDTDIINNWINGKTKDSFINANMIELKQTGWMSNRGRQNVASYLTKNLLIDWRVGASYFESMLIDYDVHSNYGNWIYNSGVGNDPIKDRKFNPKIQAERYDPRKTFQNLWLNKQYEIDL